MRTAYANVDLLDSLGLPSAHNTPSQTADNMRNMQSKEGAETEVELIWAKREITAFGALDGTQLHIGWKPKLQLSILKHVSEHFTHAG